MTDNELDRGADTATVADAVADSLPPLSESAQLILDAIAELEPVQVAAMMLAAAHRFDNDDGYLDRPNFEAERDARDFDADIRRFALSQALAFHSSAPATVGCGREPATADQIVATAIKFEAFLQEGDPANTDEGVAEAQALAAV